MDKMKTLYYLFEFRNILIDNLKNGKDIKKSPFYKCSKELEPTIKLSEEIQKIKEIYEKPTAEILKDLIDSIKEDLVITKKDCIKFLNNDLKSFGIKFDE